MKVLITEEIRTGVLSAIRRGMDEDCAARADGIPVAAVRILVKQAGGIDAVRNPTGQPWLDLKSEIQL